MRIGQGFDVHKFENGRELWLGGVKIENHIGLAGHSDADVLIHAVIDALLGACGTGDIGELFPDSDDTFKGIRSTILLEKVVSRVESAGYKIINVDSVIICETPKILPYKTKMRETLAGIMKIPLDRVMIKGKTTEKLGFTGRKEGIAAMAVALLEDRCEKN
ncbi:2-C-methyl-D-erythritol 2,4-cyclodiphosphate synthase [bacterium]|nr:2-C-methyl-D-erythritol 2,4-cyclodiphosphate synthase [bacterium]MBP5434705.1 2-C-methyl-D-erythritol 2,4-cyclodiphosphate synthase [bacterium]